MTVAGPLMRYEVRRITLGRRPVCDRARFETGRVGPKSHRFSSPRSTIRLTPRTHPRLCEPSGPPFASPCARIINRFLRSDRRRRLFGRHAGRRKLNPGRALEKTHNLA